MWGMAEMIWNGNDYEEKVVYVRCITMLWQDIYSISFIHLNLIFIKINIKNIKNKYYIKSKGDFESHKI